MPGGDTQAEARGKAALLKALAGGSGDSVRSANSGVLFPFSIRTPGGPARYVRSQLVAPVTRKCHADPCQPFEVTKAICLWGVLW